MTRVEKIERHFFKNRTTKNEKIAKIEQLKKEIKKANRQGDCSDTIVAKINECTRLALEIINEK